MRTRRLCEIFVVLLLCLSAGARMAAGSVVNQRIADGIEERALQAREDGASAREISDLYVLGAGRCRDAGGRSHVVELFQKAVEADPSNVRARRLYGDYLVGYRGMIQYGAKQYYAALEVVRQNPGACTDEEGRALERSFQILFRDANEGIPLLASDALTVFVNVEGEYSNKGIKGSELAGYEATANKYYEESYRSEREEGITYFGNLTAESAAGVKYFEGVRQDQEEGIDYFQGLVDETYAGEAYFMGKYDPVNGPVYSLDEPLDAEGNTIRKRVLEIRAARAEYEERIAAIERDIQDTDERIAAANQATEEYAQRTADLQNDVDSIEEKKKAFAEELKRRQEKWTTKGSITMRFGPVWAPYITAEAERTKADNVGYNMDSPTDGTNEGTYDRAALTLGKRWIVKNWFDVHAKGTVSQRESEVVDADNLKFNDETHNAVEGLVELSRDIGFDTVRMSFSGMTADIDVEGLDEQDSAYEWGGALRYSHYPSSELEIATERAKARVSQHVEAGVRRTYRDYHSNDSDDVVKERHWKPYVSYEALSLFNGNADFTAVYNYDDGNEVVLVETIDGKTTGQEISGGQIDSHELKLIPAWVLAYKRYENDFTTGVEYMRWKFPFTYEFGDSDYDNYRFGTGIEGDYISPWGFGLRLDLGGEYRWFESYDYSDWGVYLKCKLLPGRKRGIDRILSPVE